MIRIASGQAFWGDWPQAPLRQVRSGPIADRVLDDTPEAIDDVPEAEERL